MILLLRLFSVHNEKELGHDEYNLHLGGRDPPFNAQYR